MTLRAWSAVVTLAIPLAARAATTEAIATLKNAEGRDVGTATFAATSDGVGVHVVVSDLKPGKHGIHIHSVGKCDPPDFKSAGGHFNPAEKHHGLDSAEGPHAGDLPNLAVGNDGKATVTFTAKGASLGAGKGSLFGAEGTALVIHADADDQKTDPAGNSGARVACGVIRRREP